MSRKQPTPPPTPPDGTWAKERQQPVERKPAPPPAKNTRDGHVPSSKNTRYRHDHAFVICFFIASLIIIIQPSVLTLGVWAIALALIFRRRI